MQGKPYPPVPVSWTLACAPLPAAAMSSDSDQPLVSVANESEYVPAQMQALGGGGQLVLGASALSAAGSSTSLASRSAASIACTPYTAASSSGQELAAGFSGARLATWIARSNL